MASRIQAQLVGTLRIVDARGRDLTPKAKKVRALFGHLALELGEPVSRMKLASLLWDRSADAQAMASLRQALSDLSDALGLEYPHVVRREGDVLRIDPDHCAIDVSKYIDLQPEDPIPDEREWARICKTQVLDELDGASPSFDDWLRARRQSFRDRLQAHCEARLRKLKSDKAPAEIVATAAHRLIELDPTTEVGARARMQALAEMGRRSDALREYERCRDALRRLLDTAPSRETESLQIAIRAATAGTAPQSVIGSSRSAGDGDQAPILLKVPSEPAAEVMVPHDQATLAAGLQRLAPMVGVLPLTHRGRDPAYSVLGELIADEVIGRLSASPMLRVISRLSTSAVSGEHRRIDEIGRLLGAQFLASGGYHVVGDKVVAFLELSEATSQEIIWTDRFEGLVADVLAPEGIFTDAICAAMATAIAATERRRVHRSPLPTLEAYSLQLAGTSLIHRPTLPEFRRARDVLQHLVDRFPNSPEPRAWLGQWHVMQVTRGHAQAADIDPNQALDQTKRAIDLSPDCSLALAIEGLVHCHLRGDLDRAETALRAALDLNSNESLAWLFLSVVQVFRGHGAEGWISAERAMELSPLDPMRHYFRGLAAAAALASGRLEQAIELAKASLAINGTHIPTLRQLAVALAESGRVDEARATVSKILEIYPAFNITDYIKSAPKGGEPFRLRCAPALRLAGTPEI